MAMQSKKKGEQVAMFDTRPDFDQMPEFSHDDLLPYHSVRVHFKSKFDMEAFEQLINQRITGYQNSSLWYPEAPWARRGHLRYAGPPRHYDETSTPIYVVSKGRWKNQKTMRHLQAMGRPHYVICEPQEADLYREHMPPLSTILELDMDYKAQYDTCDDLGLTRSTGSGPARNFAWDHAAKHGHKWHWTIDDNIGGWFRFNRNLKTPCVDPGIFDMMEAYADRYTNVVMAGPQYYMFCPRRKGTHPPVMWNTRLYSCNLIRTDAPFRWRARYNEDVDLSVRMLKAGFCTVQFNMFLQDKATTQTMKGGNTDVLYAKGTLDKSEMIARLHPDIARVTHKFNRTHHHVDFSVFKKNRPQMVESYPPIIDDQWLEVLHEGEWHRAGRRERVLQYATGDLNIADELKISAKN